MIANRPHVSRLGSSQGTTSNLHVSEAAMRVNTKKYFHRIIKDNQWLVKKLDFGMDDAVTIRVMVKGEGFGYLYATFNDNNTPQILDIKKVISGVHELDFVVPYPVLSNFRVGISSTIPAGYSIDLLPKDTRYRIRTNSLMTSQHQPMYESPGIGYGAFGALADRKISNNPKGGRDSGGNPYWDGDLDTFSWATYGFSGERDVHTNTSSVAVPGAYGDYHGFYANRASIMIGVFDKDDNFLGWDTMEGSIGMGMTIPAGVPICVVMQFFTLNRKGTDKGNKDPRLAGDPYWIYANDYQIPANGFFLTTEGYRLNVNKGSLNKHSPNNYKPRPNNASKGVVKNIYKQPTYYEGKYSVQQMAAKMEWYNSTSGTWTPPSSHPTNIPRTNEKGFTKIIFRAPRQLSPETDKDIIDQLTAAGINYDYNSTKKAYPVHLKDWENPPAVDAYALVGRPNQADTFYQEGQDWYWAPKNKLYLEMYFKYGNHPKAGWTMKQKDGTGEGNRGDPMEGYTLCYGGRMYVGDVEKMARTNYPELMYAFYPSNGFKTGGKIYAIGRGLGTNLTSCISTSSNTNPINVYPVKESNPDGSKIGTQEACQLRPSKLILSTDLEDGRAAYGEEQLQAAWKEKFGKQLDLNFFTGFSLKDQIPERPHLYRIKDPASGIFIEAPYQIMIYEIGPEYNGPAVFYETIKEQQTLEDGSIQEVSKLVITKPADKPYARDKSQPIYLNTRTPYGYTRYQQIDIVEEATQQAMLLDVGLTEEEALILNELDNPPQDSTVVVNEEMIQDQYLQDLAIAEKLKQGSASKKKGKKLVRWFDSVNPFPKYYVNEELNGLGAFTNSRDFYVEDVTDKWTAGSISGLGSAGYSNLGGPFDSLLDPLNDVIADNVDAIKDYSVKTMKTAVALGGLVIFGPSLLRAAGKMATASVKNAKDIGAAFKYTPRGTSAARRRAARRR